MMSLPGGCCYSQVSMLYQSNFPSWSLSIACHFFRYFLSGKAFLHSSRGSLGWSLSCKFSWCFVDFNLLRLCNFVGNSVHSFVGNFVLFSIGGWFSLSSVDCVGFISLVDFLDFVSFVDFVSHDNCIFVILFLGKFLLANLGGKFSFSSLGLSIDFSEILEPSGILVDFLSHFLIYSPSQPSTVVYWFYKDTQNSIASIKKSLFSYIIVFHRPNYVGLTSGAAMHLNCKINLLNFDL